MPVQKQALDNAGPEAGTPVQKQTLDNAGPEAGTRQCRTRSRR
jgi:hypothetical protein